MLRQVCRLLCARGAPLHALDGKGRRPAMDTRNPVVRNTILAFERRRLLRLLLAPAAVAAAATAAAIFLVRRSRAAAAAG